MEREGEETLFTTHVHTRLVSLSIKGNLFDKKCQYNAMDKMEGGIEKRKNKKNPVKEVGKKHTNNF